MGVTLFGWEGNHRPGARQEVMAAYQQVNGLRSPVVWLPVHLDQLRAQPNAR